MKGPAGGIASATLLHSQQWAAFRLRERRARFGDWTTDIATVVRQVDGFRTARARAAWLSANQNSIHALNTPVQQIESFVVLLDAGGSDASQAELVGRLKREIDRLKEVVVGLSAGPGLRTPPSQTAWTSVIDSARTEAAAQEIKIYVAGGLGAQTGMLGVPGDLLCESVRELVRNSAKAMHRANIDTPTVTIEFVQQRVGIDRRAIIRISDNGPGVPADLEAKIFEEGFSISGFGGRGLYEMRRRLELHHSSVIYVSENESEGAVFEINVPEV